MPKDGWGVWKSQLFKFNYVNGVYKLQNLQKTFSRSGRQRWSRTSAVSGRIRAHQGERDDRNSGAFGRIKC